jgi:hypothetical protein
MDEAIDGEAAWQLGIEAMYLTVMEDAEGKQLSRCCTAYLIVFAVNGLGTLPLEPKLEQHRRFEMARESFEVKMSAQV